MLSEESDNRTALEKEIADTKQELEQRLLELDANEAEKAEEVAVSVLLAFKTFDY